MKVFEKLAIKIKKDLGIDVINFRRTYAGKHDKSAGAFVWVATNKNTNEVGGGTCTATSLLKMDKLEILRKYYAGSSWEII